MTSDVLLATRAIFELPHVYQLFDFLVLWLGPLCYGYVRGVLGYAPWRWRTISLHLLPGALLFLLLLPDILRNAASKRAAIVADVAAFAHPGSIVFVVAIGLVALAYLLASLVLMRRYWRSLENAYSSTQRYRLTWLAQLLGFCAVVWLMWMNSSVFQSAWTDLGTQLALGLGIYALGYCGLLQPRLWSSPAQTAHEALQVERQAQANPVHEAQTQTLGDLPLAPLENLPVKYAKTGQSSAALADIGARLDQLMQTELLFLEPELSLTEIASALNVSVHTLSQTLSMHFGRSFFEYVNALRVKEVERCFADPAFAKQSILEIALASGFASKATFNATFKRLSGATPSASRARFS